MDASMKRLLMITIELPYPATSGGRMKSWNMLKALSQEFEVGLVSPIKYGDVLIPEFIKQTTLIEFHNDCVEVERNGTNLLKSYLKRIPLNVMRSYSNKLKNTVKRIASSYDVILLDHYESFQYLPKNFKGKVVFHTHNATYLMWERYAHSGESFAIRLASKLESRRVKRYEKLVCSASDLIFASPNDIEHLVEIGSSRNKFRETFHLGDDSQLKLPQLHFEDTQEQLFYVGTLNWEANVDGLLWFLDNVMLVYLQHQMFLSFQMFYTL